MKIPARRQGIPIALAVLGIVMVVVSALLATVFRPDSSVTADSERPDTPYFVTAPGLLGLVDSKVTVTANAPGESIVMVLGRGDDVEAWLADLPYTQATGLASWEAISVKVHNAPSPEPTETDPTGEEPSESAPSEPAATEPETTEPEEEATAPELPALETLTSSDMWLDVRTGEGSLRWNLTDQDDDLVILAVTDGTAPAPELSLTWKRDISSAWLYALGATGAILIVLGIVLYVALRRVLLEHARSEEAKKRRREAVEKFKNLANRKPARQDAAEQKRAEEAAGDADAPQSGAVPAVAAPAEDDATKRRRIAVLERQRRMLAEERTQIETTIDGKTHVLPSRKAIREARERGEAEISMGGQTFATGLIPVIPRNEPEAGKEKEDE
ncbi:MAG: hypothetical protein Q4E01_05965 [Actinomycetaceae bacterium]|nr:hypothetical protein [Actinomycetaceae bacterium]